MAVQQERLFFAGDAEKRLAALKEGLKINIEIKSTEFGPNTYLVTIFSFENLHEKVRRLSYDPAYSTRAAVENLVCGAITESLASEMSQYDVFRVTEDNYYARREHLDYWVGQGKELVQEKGLTDPIIVAFDTSRSTKKMTYPLIVYAAGRKLQNQSS